MGISQEETKKKAHTLPDGKGDQITWARAVQEELRSSRLATKGLEADQTVQRAKCKRCGLSRCKKKEGCHEMGYFTRSSLCPKKRLTTKKREVTLTQPSPS